ncbi:hypothetical protein [Mesorhizobium sp. NZP2298]|uniref:hypothetical protein n=1 Tax=Mesorhizobium sp. NZP2298 TaxID=2483403 RepID=UPI001555AFF0|nr:hypothetical protein [Mesorhizobium sp. NZP2298]
MSARSRHPADRANAARRADAHSRCPATTRDRFALLADAPARAAQKPLDIGLFDDARNQLDLF